MIGMSRDSSIVCCVPAALIIRKAHRKGSICSLTAGLVIVGNARQILLTFSRRRPCSLNVAKVLPNRQPATFSKNVHDKKRGTKHVKKIYAQLFSEREVK